MLEGTVVIDVFYLRIGDTAVIFEKRRQVAAGDVARLIDRRRQYSTAKFAEPNRIVGSSAEKRNSKWGTGYDHAITFLLATSILGFASHSRIWRTESSSDDAVMSTCPETSDLQRTRAVLHPAFAPACISISESPIIHDDPRSMACVRAASRSIPGAGFRQLHEGL